MGLGIPDTAGKGSGAGECPSNLTFFANMLFALSESSVSFVNLRSKVGVDLPFERAGFKIKSSASYGLYATV
jgi:hypothetical protein